MDSRIIISDNHLPRTEWRSIHDMMLGNEFPWYFHEQKVTEGPGVEDLRNYQLGHAFLVDNVLRSSYMPLLSTLIASLGRVSLLRIKANLTPMTETLHTYPMHTDYDYENVRTAVYYVNDNDGATVFDSGERIANLANRLVTFPAPIVHAGTSCTDTKVRCVINLNFVPLT